MCLKELPRPLDPNVVADGRVVVMVTVALPVWVPSNVRVVGDTEQVELRGAPEHVREIC